MSNLSNMHEGMDEMGDHLEAQQAGPVAEVVVDTYADHEGRIEADVFLAAGTKLYAAPPSPLAEQDKDDAELAIALAALEKLSRLGHGPRAGNSIGNLIAQEALAAIRATRATARIEYEVED